MPTSMHQTWHVTSPQPHKLAWPTLHAALNLPCCLCPTRHTGPRWNSSRPGVAAKDICNYSAGRAEAGGSCLMSRHSEKMPGPGWVGVIRRKAPQKWAADSGQSHRPAWELCWGEEICWSVDSCCPTPAQRSIINCWQETTAWKTSEFMQQ